MSTQGSQIWELFLCPHPSPLPQGEGISRKDQMTNKTIDQLTALMHNFVRSKGWYEENSKRPQTPRNLSTSLALEAGEILEHFQWNEEFVKEDLAEELADVALYLLQLADVTEIDLEKAILDKLEINAKRKWD